MVWATVMKFGNMMIKRVVRSNSMVADVALFVPVIVMKILFIASYPLNITGDGYNYYVKMLLPGRGFLVHADGYPFIMGMFLHNFQEFIASRPVLFELCFVIFQHLLDLCVLIVLYVVIKRYDRFVAVFSLYYSGISVFYLSDVSSSTPVWMQSGLWIIFIALLIRGWQSADLSRLNWFYVLSVVVFMFAYLVRYNSFVLVLFYMVFLYLHVVKGTILKFVRNFLLGCVLSLVLFVIYLYGFHQPTTGTTDLHYDSGWVLMARTNPLFSVGNGINSKRLSALNGVLPEYFYYEPYYIDMWKNIEEVPASERVVYRDVYEHVMDLSNEELDLFMAVNPPLKTNDFVDYVLRVQYYIGLKEGDDLGRSAAVEAIRDQPGRYLFEALKKTLTFFPKNWNIYYIPSLEQIEEVAELHKIERYGYVYYTVPYYSWNQQFRTVHNVSWFWVAGLNMIKSLAVNIGGASIIVMSLGFSIGIYLIFIKKEKCGICLALLILCGFTLLFKLASNLVWVFRPSELRAVYPLLGVSVGISIKLVWIKIDNALRWLLR